MPQPILIQSTRQHGSGDNIVLLVPSLGRGAADFDDLAVRLAAAGYCAIAVEPAGIAKSSALIPPATLHDYAADIATNIELRGRGPVHVIGHALGNRIVRTLAADRPDLVRSVTLIACGGQVEGDEEARAALPRCFDLDLPDAERMPAIATAFFAPGNDPSVWRDGWYPAVMRQQGAAVRATPGDNYRHAGSAPMLIIQGLQDRLAVPANGRLLKEELGERVTLVELEGAGHALLPEQPEAIAAALIEFLYGRYVKNKVAAGIADLDAGRKTPHAQVMARFAVR